MAELEQMRCFVRVVDAGSLSAAAQQQGMAKSAVSRRLAYLETRPVTRLLQRTTRRMSLTDTGRSFYDRCIQILADVADAEDAVSSSTEALSGPLRIASPLSFGLARVGAVINEFLAAHPDVEFDVDLNDRRVDLVQEGFDVAIRTGDLADSGLLSRRIIHLPHVVVASPEYWRSRGKPLQPSDLSQHAGLRYTN